MIINENERINNCSKFSKTKRNKKNIYQNVNNVIKQTNSPWTTSSNKQILRELSSIFDQINK